MAIAKTIENLCLVNDVKIRMGYPVDDDKDDDMINQIIAGLSPAFDEFCQRKFILNQADATEYYDGGKEIHLKRYPVYSITSIKIANDWGWTNADALDSDVDYRLKDETGVIYYTTSYGWPWEPADMEGNFPTGIDNLQVIYRGGYVGPSGDVLAGMTGLPGDIREAAIQQACYYLKRRHDIGLTAVSAEGQNITKYAPYDLLPSVKNILMRHHR